MSYQNGRFLMDCLGDKFFTRSCFSQNQNVEIGMDDDFNFSAQALDLLRVANNFGMLV